MDSFTPIAATIGGTLIGLAAVMLMAFNGRIAGISGVFSGSVFAEPGDRLWRVFFIIGVIAAPLFYGLISGVKLDFDMAAGWPVILVGGVCVGFGTRLGSGCTSGHGVCGLSRLSPRSFVAVGLFMAAGMVTVSAVRTVLGG